MCGIFGVFKKSGLNLEDRWLLRRMADNQVHRGPDGEGFHVSKSVAIGMRRLAIIDPNGGWQPIYNEDRSIALVANGEIYNFVELRRDLIARGHRFETGSDCETIIHLYEEYGADCVGHLRGMFAFALIDERNNKLILARDRMGEKPLILAEFNEHLVFCSELSGLVGSGAIPFEMDPNAIKMFYYWGYIPEPLSAVKNTRKLAAGSIFEIDLQTGVRQEKKYWCLEDAPPIEGDAIEIIRNEIKKIGEITMRSDVPIGIGLSAGIDSSAIAALAKKHARQPITAFSIGYSGKSWQDESFMAEDFAHELGIPFHRAVLDVERVVREFPEMCLRRDEPIADLAGSSIYALMRLSREHNVPVLLSGLGGDELFWGYSWHRNAVYKNQRKRALLAGDANILNYLKFRSPPISVTGFINWLGDGAGFLGGIREWKQDFKTNPDRLIFWDEVRDFRIAESGLDAISGPNLRTSTLSAAEPFTSQKYWNDIETSMTERICSTYLRSNGLDQTDRLSMACSVEGRVPFVDYRIAELAVGLRKSKSDLDLGHKGRLKAAFSDLLPQNILTRPKRGFAQPWRIWIRELMLNFSSDISSGFLVNEGMVNRDATLSMAKVFDHFRRPYPFALETLVLEQWARGMSALIPKRNENHSAEPILTNSQYLRFGP